MIANVGDSAAVVVGVSVEVSVAGSTLVVFDRLPVSMFAVFCSGKFRAARTGGRVSAAAMRREFALESEVEFEKARVSSLFALKASPFVTSSDETAGAASATIFRLLFSLINCAG